jgi:hypothetical protein
VVARAATLIGARVCALNEVAAMRTSSPVVGKHVMRGLAVQPFIGAILGFALFPLAAYMAGGGHTIRPFGLAIVFGVVIGIIATLITGLAAYPTLLFMLKRGPVTLARTLLAGVALGNIPAAIGTLLGAGSARAAALGSTLGLISAAVFWVIAKSELTAVKPQNS